MGEMSSPSNPSNQEYVHGKQSFMKQGIIICLFLISSVLLASDMPEPIPYMENSGEFGSTGINRRNSLEGGISDIFANMSADEVHSYLDDHPTQDDINLAEILELLSYPDDEIKLRVISTFCIDAVPEIVSSLTRILFHESESLEIRNAAAKRLHQLKPFAVITAVRKLQENNSEDPLLDEIFDGLDSLREESRALGSIHNYLTALVEYRSIDAYMMLGSELERETNPYKIEGCVSPYYKRFVLYDITGINGKFMVTAQIFLEWAGEDELGFRKDLFTVENIDGKFRITERIKGKYVAFD